MLTLLVTAAIAMSSVVEMAFALGNDEPSNTANGDDFDGGIGSENGGGNPTCTDIALQTGGKNNSFMTAKHCIADYGEIEKDQNNTLLSTRNGENCVSYLGQSCDIRNGENCAPGAQECNPNISTDDSDKSSNYTSSNTLAQLQSDTENDSTENNRDQADESEESGDSNEEEDEQDQSK